jgi:hypothetical protein
MFSSRDTLSRLDRALVMLMCSAGFIWPASAHADDVPDTVFLRNGGRARGMVIESDPHTGTRMQLPDGTVRSYDAAAVDHITYGTSPQPTAAQPTPAAKPAAQPKVAQPAPAVQPLPAPAVQPKVAQPAPAVQPKSVQPAPAAQPKSVQPAPAVQPLAAPAVQPLAAQPKVAQPAAQPRVAQPAPAVQPLAAQPAPAVKPLPAQPAPAVQPLAAQPAPAVQPLPAVQPKAAQPAPAVQPLPAAQPKAAPPAPIAPPASTVPPAPATLPAPTAPPTAAQPMLEAASAWTSATASAVLGTLRVESSEPGDVFIEGAGLGPAPVVINNVAAGPHDVQIRFHVGDNETQRVFVRAGDETVVHFDEPAAKRAFRAHQGVGLGLGVDGSSSVLGLGGGNSLLGVRAFLRVNYAVSPRFELHADLRLGAFPGSAEKWDARRGTYYEPETTMGAAVRLALQLNVKSIYVASIGVDLGVAKGVGGFAGAHVSPLGFRMGSERSTLLAFQLGVITGDDPLLDWQVALSYLF